MRQLSVLSTVIDRAPRNPHKFIMSKSRKARTRIGYNYLKFCLVRECRHHKKAHVEIMCSKCNHHWIRCKMCEVASSKVSDQDTNDLESHDHDTCEKPSGGPVIICKTCTCGLHLQSCSSKSVSPGTATEIHSNPDQKRKKKNRRCTKKPKKRKF